MKALLIKDILNIKAQGKAILLVLAIWFIISVFNGSGSFFAALSVVYAILLPLTSVTADDKCGFERYACPSRGRLWRSASTYSPLPARLSWRLSALPPAS